jgi:tetratricopeptide (TPR) repeat protein
VSLILAFFLFYVLILSKSQFIQSDTQRYFIPLFAGLPLLWAFPLYRLIKRSRFLGITLLSAFMIFHFFVYYNEATVFHPKKLKLYESRQRGEADLLRFLENHNMKHVYYHDYWLGFRLNFTALEKITFVQTQNERYEPYQRKLEAMEDPVFVDRSGELFDPVFKMIGGVCRSVRVNRFSIYHDFQEPARQYRQLEPNGMKAEASIGSEDLQGLFDRNSRTSWNSGKPRSNGMWVKFDLGKIVTLGMVRLWSRPIHFNNYAMDASIDVSLDGQNWISVLPRTKSDYYYWSGPRIYYWELSYRWEARFPPTQARYVRIHQYEDELLHSWIIGEAYFYEDLGKRVLRHEGEEALLKAVMDLNLERVYSDRWMNAKLREKSDGRIETYHPVTRSASPISRVVQWGPKVGFILEDSDADQFEAMMKDEKIHLIRKKFGRWELFYFLSWGEREEALKQDRSHLWIGTGVVCGNPRLRTQHLERLGEKSQSAGQFKKAVKYYEESLNFYQNNQGARRKLATLLESLGRHREAQKHKEVLKEQVEPEYPRRIEFEKGIEFVGYRFDSGPIKPGQTRKIVYYWRLNQEIKKMLGVFVHVEGMGKLFHGDHQFLIQDREWIPPLLKDEVFRQECLLEIPKDAPPGLYKIRIGLFDLKTGSRLKVKKTALEHQEKRVLIGSFDVKR